ncbi:hypothetical protein SAMN06272722_110257 [Paenibacillus sp. RU5A]|nr:hypothetical protein SAMN06272722_110257 [Paenibacillus sp. RU5A]SOC74488.1 hypothetical protein SAMN05880581_110257 [Paenibacillus sp. RU26A]SOC76676.1 hypothetical protein SAMN05880586_110257 [Paenibacillus sp. RU5M]
MFKIHFATISYDKCSEGVDQMNNEIYEFRKKLTIAYHYLVLDMYIKKTALQKNHSTVKLQKAHQLKELLESALT